jgi:transcription elongation factor B subunit 1
MPRQTVKLVSAEGHEFIIDYKAACVSNTIRNMLSSQGASGMLTRPAAQ